MNDAKDLATLLYLALSPEDKRLADKEIAIKKRLHIPVFEPYDTIGILREPARRTKKRATQKGGN